MVTKTPPRIRPVRFWKMSANSVKLKARQDLSSLNSKLVSAGVYNNLVRKKIQVWMPCVTTPTTVTSGNTTLTMFLGDNGRTTPDH